MSAFLSSRLAIGLLALFSLLTTVALTIGGISLTRAGIVSVLPVTSQQSGITVCGHGKATAKPDQARLSLGVVANAASAQDAEPGRASDDQRARCAQEQWRRRSGHPD